MFRLVADLRRCRLVGGICRCLLSPPFKSEADDRLTRNYPENGVLSGLATIRSEPVDRSVTVSQPEVTAELSRTQMPKGDLRGPL